MLITSICSFDRCIDRDQEIWFICKQRKQVSKWRKYRNSLKKCVHVRSILGGIRLIFYYKCHTNSGQDKYLKVNNYTDIYKLIMCTVRKTIHISYHPHIHIILNLTPEVGTPLSIGETQVKYFTVTSAIRYKIIISKKLHQHLNNIDAKRQAK